MYLGHLRADKIKPALIYGTSGHISFCISLAKIPSLPANFESARVALLFLQNPYVTSTIAHVQIFLEYT